MKTTYIIRDPDQGFFAAAIADTVSTNKPDHVIITRINVMEKWRGQGYGTKILLQLLKDADEQGITLVLEPIESGGLSQAQLQKWYERHDFVWSDWHMIRKPKGGR